MQYYFFKRLTTCQYSQSEINGGAILSNQDELFPIKLNENVIFEVNKLKFLGLHLADNLKWSAHINFISNKLRVCLGIINRVRDRFNT